MQKAMDSRTRSREQYKCERKLRGDKQLCRRLFVIH
jgi:hypothetical protein